LYLHGCQGKPYHHGARREAIGQHVTYSFLPCVRFDLFRSTGSENEGKALGPSPHQFPAGTSIGALYEQGYDLVLGGFDMIMLREAMRANVADHRRAMGR